MLYKSARLGAILFVVMSLSTFKVHAGSWQQNVSIGGFNAVNIYTPDSVSPIGTGIVVFNVFT